MNLGWCEGVTEEGVRGLAHCCTNLEVLDLCGCVKAGPCMLFMSMVHAVCFSLPPSTGIAKTSD